jgi:hypothetical protein
MLERSEGLADGTKHYLQEIQGNHLHLCGRTSYQSTQPGHLTYLTPIISAEVRNLQICSYVGYIQSVSVFSDGFHSDSTLILKTTVMNQYMDIDARSYGCGVSKLF